MPLSKLFTGLFFIIISVTVPNSINAQLCLPDPIFTGNGVYPDTITNMATGCEGSFYAQTFTINVPPDTLVFGFNFTIIYMQVDSVSGLPPGLTYGCNPITCQYPGNSSGCFQVYGIPTVSGVFNITFYIHGQAFHPMFGTQTVNTPFAGYQLLIGVHPSLITGNIPATCDSNNASAWVIPSGSSGYSYNWNTIPVSVNDTIFDQASGIYQITVSDLYNCSTTDTVFINDLGAPEIDSIGVIHNLCYGDSTGSATAFVTGGTAPYLYVWSNGDSVVTMNGVPAGTYLLQVADLHGCIANDVAVINTPSELLAFATHVDALCYGNNDGSTSATVVGGTGAYSYSWSSGDSTLIADALLSGNYTITVTDNNGCTATSSTTVSEPFALVTNVVGNNVLCFGDSTGTANVGVGGGTPGFTYVWSNGDSSATIIGLSTGTYYLTVTDTNGCSTTDSVFIDQPPPLTVSFTATPESMLTMLDGSVDATPGGGTPLYTYLWSNGAITQDISALAGGTYTLTITDDNGCILIDTITVQTLPGFGIEEVNELFEIYPNPAHEFLNVVMHSTATLSLFDLTGKLILSKNVVKGNQMIELSMCSKGVYMLSVMVGNQRRVTKLIID